MGREILTEHNGYIADDGNPKPNQNVIRKEKYTDAFAVKEGDAVDVILEYSVNRSMKIWRAFYTEDNLPIENSVEVLYNDLSDHFSGHVEIPSGVAFVRFSFYGYDDYDFHVYFMASDPRPTKNIPAIKIGNDVYEIKDLAAREHMIEVRDTQPDSDDNKIWIKSGEEAKKIATRIGQTDDYIADLGEYAYSNDGSFQYKGADGRYVGVHVLAERATSDLIADLRHEEANLKTNFRSLLVWQAQKGVAGGVASLGDDGKVPSTQLPSYVDDVLEGYINPAERTRDQGVVHNFYIDKTYTTKLEAKDGKIYVDINDVVGYENRVYRWSGTQYIEVSNPKDMIRDDDSGLTDGEKANYAWSILKVSGKFDGVNREIQGIKDSKGAANGIATLDSNRKVYLSQLQNVIDDTADGTAADDDKITWSVSKLADLYAEFKEFKYYTAITCSEVSLSVQNGNGRLAETDSIVTSVTLTYKFNQKPYQLKLNNTPIDPVPDSYNPGHITDATMLGLPRETGITYTIYATDRTKIDDPDTSRRWISRGVTLQFTNKVKFGGAAAPDVDMEADLSSMTTEQKTAWETAMNTFLNSLPTRILSTGVYADLKATASGTTQNPQYVWYALPHNYATNGLSFYDDISHATGGFKFITRFNHKNESTIARDKSTTVSYDVYRSINPNIGSIDFTVSAL